MKHPQLVGFAFGVAGLALLPLAPPIPVNSAAPQGVVAAEAGKGTTPRFVNARVDSRQAGTGFPHAFESLVAAQSAPAWIGYSVRAVPGRWDLCESCGRTFLEGRPTRSQTDVAGAALEEPAWIAVLFRAEQSRVQKIRIVSCDQEVDAGGLPVFWLTGVGASESIAVLSPFVTSAAAPTASTPSSNVAMTAVAAHADALATTALIGWAKTPNAPEVRKRAISWLGQKAGTKVAGTLVDAAANDPDLAIKERAVFALSRLPGSEAADKLIEVANTNPNLAVRKRALFWLGQSSDPRALEYLVSVLKR